MAGTAGFLPPIVAVLTANISEFSAKMAEAKGEMAGVEDTSSKFGVMGKAALLGVAAGAIAIGGESVKMASDFQSTMELIATQAHAGQSEVDSMKQSVLNLAPAVGIGPEKLAEGLYHIESTGLRGKAALDVLQSSAQEAALGMANFDDVTYAMSGVMSVGMKDVKNAADGVAYLNTIVGTGDMRMGDLAQAIGTGVLPAFKNAGLGMTDFGAAMSTLTDNSMPAQVAANHLRTAVALIQNQSKPAAAALASIGIGQGQLAKDLAKPDGLLVAMQDLQDHLKKSGKTAVEQGQIISKAFGGAKSASTVETLLGELDKLKGKYKEMGGVAARAKQQQDDWQHAQSTFKQKMNEVGAQIQAWGIEIGTKLLPILSKVADWFMHSVSWLGQHQAIVKTLAAVLGTVLVGALMSVVIWAGKTAVSMVTGPIKSFIAVGKGAAGFAKNIMGGLSGAESAVGTWGGRFGKLLSGTGKVASTIFQGIGSSAKTIFGGIGRVVSGFGSVITDTVLPALGSFASSIGSVASTVGGAVVNGIKTLGIAIAESLWPALVEAAVATWSFTVALLANPITWIVIAIIALVAAIILIITHWKQVESFLRGAWNAFIGWAKGIWNSIKDFFVGLWNDVKNWFMSVWNSIVNWLKQMWQKEIEGWKLIWNKVKDFFTDLWNGVKNWFVNIWNDITSWLKNKWNEAVQTDVLIWNDIKKFFSNLWNGVKDFFVNIWNDIVNWLKNKWQMEIEGWKIIWNNLKTFFSNLWTNIKNGVTTAWNDIANFISNIPNDIWGFFKDAGSWLLNAGEAILNGLLNGLINAWNNVTSFIGGIGNWISNHKGPIEYDRQLLVPHGNAIMDGLHQGLKEGGQRVQSFLTGFTTSIGQTAINGAMSVEGNGMLGSTVGGGNQQVIFQLNTRDVQALFQQGILRFNMRNSSNGLAVRTS